MPCNGSTGRAYATKAPIMQPGGARARYVPHGHRQPQPTLTKLDSPSVHCWWVPGGGTAGCTWPVQLSLCVVQARQAAQAEVRHSPSGRVARWAHSVRAFSPSSTRARSRLFQMASSSWLGAVPMRPGWIMPAKRTPARQPHLKRRRIGCSRQRQHAGGNSLHSMA